MSTKKKPSEPKAVPEIYSFDDHPEHKEKLGAWAERWIEVALRTRAQSEDDREHARVAIRGLYRAANLEVPKIEIFCQSPISAAIAAPIASCVWWLREHPERHTELFGRVMDESEIMASIAPAVEFVVRVANGQPAKLDAATRAATDAATYAATRAATDAATDAATYAATRAATYAATRAATDAATAIAEPTLVRFLVLCTQYWGRFQDPGNQGASWTSYLSFFREIAGLQLPVHEHWIHYENAAVFAGPRFMHEKFWIASDFPTVISRDERNLPHSANGPALAWSDGWALYYWHGVRVPREWIESTSSLDPEVAITHENAELRRCAAEIIGWDKILAKLDARTIDTDADPSIGELVEATVEERRERFLRVTCGTGRRFALPVPPETQTAIGAQAWIHDVPESVIRALEVRT